MGYRLAAFVLRFGANIVFIFDQTAFIFYLKTKHLSVEHKTLFADG